MVTTDTLEATVASPVAGSSAVARGQGVMQAHRGFAGNDALGPGEVRLSGTFREVDWISRTAQLYVDGDDGDVTTVRFTEAQDGWMRLVANVPVNVWGTWNAAGVDAPANGRVLSDLSSRTKGGDGCGTMRNGAARTGSAGAGDTETQPRIVDLMEVRVAELGWSPYDDDDFECVVTDYRYDPATHKMLSFHVDTDEFMRDVRGPDYQGSGL